MDEEAGGRRSGRSLEIVGVAAAAVTLASLFVGQAAMQYAAVFAAPATASVPLRPHFNAIDYATTASIKSGTVVIGPCDSRTR